VLEELNGTRERRLAHVAALGRLREIERLRYGQEIANLVYLHEPHTA
jgi:hypothetical protein